jgi:uncharacterized OsmC-like protein
MTTSTTTQPLLNGVNVEAVLGAREVMTSVPAAAQFQWRVTSEWVNGIHTRSEVSDYFGAGEEQRHRQTFVYDTDHPELFAAEDNGSTPIEMVLVGLAGCLTGGIAAVATNRGVQLRSAKAVLTGDMDLQGVLGIDPDVRTGFSSVTVRYEIEADASRADIEAIVAQAQKRSAVFDIMTNPTNVVVEVA